MFFCYSKTDLVAASKEGSSQAPPHLFGSCLCSLSLVPLKKISADIFFFGESKMQKLTAKLKEERRMRKQQAALNDVPLTISERVAALKRRQLSGEQLFCVQQVSIFRCAETNDLAGLRDFRSGLHPVDIDAQNEWGNSCLILASERGHLETVKFLVDDGARVSLRNQKGQTAVHAAVVGGHSEVLRFLATAQDLDGTPIVCARDKTGALPAHYAAQADNAHILKVLLDCCPDRPRVLEGTMHNGLSPAHCAALFNSPKALDFLHQAGCDLEKPDLKSQEACAQKAKRVEALDALDFLRSITTNFGSSSKNPRDDNLLVVANDDGII